jgi:FO synthase
VITFCRVRPGPLTEARAVTCRREGTSAVELGLPRRGEVSCALAAGLLPVGGAGAAGVAAWVVPPAEALELAAAGVAGWRLTVLDRGPGRAVTDALARCDAAFLRTGRSRVSGAVRRARGTAASVSVFADDVGQATAAVAAGAGDLLLRDWDTERLGELRAALAGHLLVERSALPPGLAYDAVTAGLGPELLRAYLGLVDGSGAVRPRHDWAPGRDLPVPAQSGRLSAEWADPAWAGGEDSGEVRPRLAEVLGRCLQGERPTRAETELLLTARGFEVEAVAATADARRQRVNGDIATYVVNRNINYTNRCAFGCGFCAFSRGEGAAPGREAPFLMTIEEIAGHAAAAAAAGASEVCLQGGIHPAFTGEFYAAVVAAVKAAAPEVHLHAFSPLEVWQGAHSLGVTVADFLRRLRDLGLGSLPGTAAEILDDGVRRVLCPRKIDVGQWVEVVETAHRLGIPTTATIMFGHVDGPACWARHLEVVRRLQQRTGGFTEFVPLPFVHMGAPLYRQGRARPGPTWDEVVLLHAVSRLAFDGLVANVQASWVKLGLSGAGRLLAAGANDLGGTLVEESISRAAGAAHGAGVTPADLEETIRAAGRRPARRSTDYSLLPAAPAPRPAG